MHLQHLRGVAFRAVEARQAILFSIRTIGLKHFTLLVEHGTARLGAPMGSGVVLF